MIKFILGISLTIGTFSMCAQNLDVGVRIQKTHNMYWENGITAQYSFQNFKPEQFSIGFSYISSRLGTAWGTNALKQDNYIANATWNFGQKPKSFKFYGRLNVGYFYAEKVADIFEEVPNKAMLFSPEFGLSYSFEKYPINLRLGSGYYIITAETGTSPGTLQPFYYHLDVSYRIFNK